MNKKYYISFLIAFSILWCLGSVFAFLALGYEFKHQVHELVFWLLTLIVLISVLSWKIKKLFL